MIASTTARDMIADTIITTNEAVPIQIIATVPCPYEDRTSNNPTPELIEADVCRGGEPGQSAWFVRGFKHDMKAWQL